MLAKILQVDLLFIPVRVFEKPVSKKTTFRVRAKRWDLFNRECKVMSLRRDDLLSRLLPPEISIADKLEPCDPVGARWLKDRWVTMWNPGDSELVAVPVLLEDDVLDKLNELCTSKNIPRDAFIDCAIEFWTSRLYDAALVIKNPRGESDIASRVAEIMMDDDLPDSQVKQYLFEIASDWIKGRNLSAWDQSTYEKRLSYSAQKVESEILMLQLFTEKNS
jgi:hypothetical protein